MIVNLICLACSWKPSFGTIRTQLLSQCTTITEGREIPISSSSQCNQRSSEVASVRNGTRKEEKYSYPYVSCYTKKLENCQVGNRNTHINVLSDRWQRAIDWVGVGLTVVRTITRVDWDI